MSLYFRIGMHNDDGYIIFSFFDKWAAVRVFIIVTMLDCSSSCDILLTVIGLEHFNIF